MTDEQRSHILTDFDGELSRLPASVDRAAVERMQVVAHVLDEGVRIPGIGYRIGLDPLVGVVPGVGDVLTGGLSLYIVVESARLGVSNTTLLRMLANIAVDVGAGTVPVVGDLFDAVWKANKRNVKLLLEDLTTDSDRSPSERVEIDVE